MPAARRLLIVEDSPEDREFYRRLLTPAGPPEFDFVETDRGEAGHAQFRYEPPE